MTHKKNILPIMAFVLVINACSEDRTSKQQPSLNIEKQNDFSVEENSVVDVVDKKERFLDEDIFIRNYNLPESEDADGLIECPNIVDVCSVISYNNYLIFGEILEIFPMNEQIKYNHDDCTLGYYKHVVIRLLVIEEFKKKKELQSDVVDIVLNEISVKRFNPTIRFDLEDNPIWIDLDKNVEVAPLFGKGDIIGLISNDVKEQDILMGFPPLMNLDSELNINVQKEVTCWKNNQFQSLNISELRNKINKCDAALKFESENPPVRLLTEERSCK